MKKVAVIMGSDSDWPVVKGACQQLAAFGIRFDSTLDAFARCLNDHGLQ